MVTDVMVSQRGSSIMDHVDEFIRQYDLDIYMCYDNGIRIGEEVICDVCKEPELPIWRHFLLYKDGGFVRDFKVCAVCMEVLKDRVPTIQTVG